MFRFRASMLAFALSALIPLSALACNVPRGQPGMLSEVVQLVNAERARAGLPRLAPSSALQTAAQGHACDNAGRNVMTHKGSDGSSVGARVRRAGYRPSSVNENVAYGYRSAAQAVSLWMGSPPHRKNILSPKTREIGVGLAQSAAGSPHWVMVSASR